jgi:hypothetical protein
MENLVVYSSGSRHPAPSLLTNMLFSSVLCVVGLMLLLLAAAAVSPLPAAIGGGLVGCGTVGVYRCWRNRRNGQT